MYVGWGDLGLRLGAFLGEGTWGRRNRGSGEGDSGEWEGDLGPEGEGESWERELDQNDNSILITSVTLVMLFWGGEGCEGCAIQQLNTIRCIYFIPNHQPFIY